MFQVISSMKQSSAQSMDESTSGGRAGEINAPTSLGGLTRGLLGSEVVYSPMTTLVRKYDI